MSEPTGQRPATVVNSVTLHTSQPEAKVITGHLSTLAVGVVLAVLKATAFSSTGVPAGVQYVIGVGVPVMVGVVVAYLTKHSPRTILQAERLETSWRPVSD